MRIMEIRGFPGSKIQLTDLGWLIKIRLTKDLILWPDQAVPLVGYMAWPNAAEVRERWLNAHRCDDRAAIKALAGKLKIVQHNIGHASQISSICIMSSRRASTRGAAVAQA
jgi:hypothetical protein